MKTKLLPIIFIGGAGGSFLSYILDSALIKRSLSDKPVFTKYGSAHLMHRYYVPYTHVTNPIDQQIKSFLDFHQVKPYLEDENSINSTRDEDTIFLGFHASNIDSVMQHTERAILITYDVSDINDIVTAYMGKRLLDGYFYPDGTRDYIAENDLVELALHYKTHLKLLTDFQKSFVPRYDFGHRLLNISWTELVYGPVDSLIKILADFTGYEIERFDAETIAKWQRLTLYCIKDLEILIAKLQHG